MNTIRKIIQNAKLEIIACPWRKEYMLWRAAVQLSYDERVMTSVIKKYLKETRRPIYAASLTLPFFLVYHVGTLVLHTTYINGADALIIRVLSALSVHSIFASALVLVACFILRLFRPVQVLPAGA